MNFIWMPARQECLYVYSGELLFLDTYSSLTPISSSIGKRVYFDAPGYRTVIRGYRKTGAAPTAGVIAPERVRGFWRFSPEDIYVLPLENLLIKIRESHGTSPLRRAFPSCNDGYEREPPSNHRIKFAFPGRSPQSA